MNLPPKIRSDYHHMTFNGDDAQRRWVKPSVWLVVGIIIGLICTQILMTKKDTEIAFNESLPTMAYQA